MARSGVLLAAVTLVACSHALRQVSQSGHGAYEVSLAVLDDGFVVAWHDHRDGNAEIYARVLDERGRPQSAERRLTNTPAQSYEADLAVVDEDIVVAWYERSAEGDLEARVGRWTLDGRRQWEQAVSSPDRDGRNPVVLVRNGVVFCAWLEDGTDGTELWSHWLDVDGRPLGAARRVANASRTTWHLNGELGSDGQAWVVFDAVVGTKANELFVARIPPPSARRDVLVMRVTDDDGYASKYPDVSLGPAAALTWFDERDGNREVYLAVQPIDALLTEPLDDHAIRVTTTPGESIGAYVAWGGQVIGLAWSDEERGPHEVFFRSFSRHGQPHGDLQQLSHNETASLIPAIEPTPDGFALAWNEDVVSARRAHGTGGQSEIVFVRTR